MATAIPSEESPLLNHQSSTNDNGDQNNPVASGDEVAVVDEPTNAYLQKSLIGIYLSAFVAAIDSSMIATLSAPISETFGSLSRLSWLASAFFIATAAVQPLSGKLTDIYGRRNGAVVTNVIFALGNSICALSQSEWTLICGRLVAGVGGGGLMAITTFVLSDLVPLRRRGIWQGFGNMGYGVGSGLGGFFGGWINDTLGWRAAFALQVPITLIAVVVIYLNVKIPIVDIQESKLRRIDFLGATTHFTTLVLLLFALSSGGNIFPWSHPAVLTTLPLSLVSLMGFVWVELKYATEPIIPIGLLWKHSVIGAILTSSFMSMAQFALLFYLPIFLRVQGYSATDMGLRLVPGSVALACTTMACGILVRWTGRYYKLGIFAQIIYLVNIAMISTLNLNTPSWPPFAYFFFANVGYGVMLTTSLLALLAAVEQKDQAVTLSALFAFRNTGTVLGISLASLTFQNVLRRELWKSLGGIEDAIGIMQGIIADIGAISKLPQLSQQQQALQAYMTALRAVFLVLCGMSSIAVVSCLIIKDRELASKMSRRAS